MFTELINLALENLLFFALHLESGGVFPKPLSPAEEEECFRKMHEGDSSARNKLIEHNLRLVAHIMKKYYTQAEDVDDLISIGTIGLIKGINTYKADKGVKLATYASRCIENEILMYFRGQKKTAGDMSLSEALDVDGDGNSLSVMDVVAQEDDMAERIGSEEICGNLRRYIASELTDRESRIVTLRYGLDGNIPKTQREVAKICNISRSYVSRIEKKALEKLRAALGDEANPL